MSPPLGMATDSMRVRRHSDSAWELHRAVLVGVFQANVEDRGLVAAVQTFLQLFFGDAFDGHGAILAVPRRIVKVAGSAAYAERCCRGDVAGDERHRTRRSGHPLAAPPARVIGTSTGWLCTAQPFDRFPQWMQRRKMEPDAQVTP